MTRVIRGHCSPMEMISHSGKINSKNMGYIEILNLSQL